MYINTYVTCNISLRYIHKILKYIHIHNVYVYIYVCVCVGVYMFVCVLKCSSAKIYCKQLTVLQALPQGFCFYF